MIFAPTNPADPLGFDLAVGPQPDGTVDMDRSGRACSGAELVRNALISRCMADTISMVNAPGGFVSYGVDVRAWVGSPVTSGTTGQRQQLLAVVFQRDPRVDPSSITVAITSARVGSQYAFHIAVTARTTSATPIAFVLGVSAITVDILAERG